MQLCNLTVRLGGSLSHTVCKIDATPAEILILKHIHGDDAVVDIIPTSFDKSRRNEAEYERLVNHYDQASALHSSPGESEGALMPKLFPGAQKKLPATLDDIGLGHLASPAAVKAAKRGAGARAPKPVETNLNPVDDTNDDTDATDENGGDEDATDGGDGNDATDGE